MALKNGGVPPSRMQTVGKSLSSRVFQKDLVSRLHSKVPLRGVSLSMSLAD